MTTHSRKPFALDLVTLGLLVGSALLTAAAYNRLPDPMATHFDIHGRPNGWMPRALGAGFIPATGAGVVALVRFGGALLPAGWRERLEASPVRLVALALAGLLGGTQLLMLRASLAASPHLGTTIWTLLGALFVFLGLVLPRTRRNPFFGVRTAFALASDENWARTQRVGGYAMAIGGSVMFVAGLLGAPAVAVAALVVSSVAPVAWSWIVARRGPGDIPMSR